MLFEFAKFPNTAIVAMLLVSAVLVYAIVQHLSYKNGFRILKQTSWLVLYIGFFGYIDLNWFQ